MGDKTRFVAVRFCEVPAKSHKSRVLFPSLVDQRAKTKLDSALCFLVMSQPSGENHWLNRYHRDSHFESDLKRFAQAISKYLRSSGCQENA